MAQRIEIKFDDDWLLSGYGTFHVEQGQLEADGKFWTQKGDIVYLDFAHDVELLRDGRVTPLDPGEYVICRGGLYERIAAP